MLSAISRSLVRAPLWFPARAYTTARKGVPLKSHKYTAHATASGQGRNGKVISPTEMTTTTTTTATEPFSLRLAMPTALGGKGDGQTPEQLFAMGYASCFLGALQMMAGRTGKTESARNAIVHASVHLGEPEELGGFGLAVDIKVEGVEDEELIMAGHDACPYSRALTHGAVVNVSKA